jgi:hypothetical protein
LVHDVGGYSLHGVVELVPPQTVAHLLHEEVRPSRVHLSMLVLVLLNGCQSLLESLGVQHGVQCVTGDR